MFAVGASALLALATLLVRALVPGPRRAAFDRVAWFVVLYLGGVGALALVSLALRTAIPR